MHRRAVAAVLAFSLAAPASVAASRVWCRMGSAFVADACCVEGRTPIEPTVSRARCCELEVAKIARAASQPPVDPMPGTTFAAAFVRADVVPEISSALALPARFATGPPGPPLRIRFVTLLL